MRRRNLHPLILAFVAGMVVGAVVWASSSLWRPATVWAQPSPSAGATLATLQTEVERLKQVVPDQAHAMHDVDYHFTNLWFAADQQHWDLAQFYFNETRSHLRWAVRIIPVRKDSAGREIKLQDILQAVENTPLKQLEESIHAKEREKFVAAYKFTLESCYSCHKAADKPFLRPKVPERAASTIMNFDPEATWPK